MKYEILMFAMVFILAGVFLILPLFGVDLQYEIFCKTFGFCQQGGGGGSGTIPTCNAVGKPPCTRYIYAQTELTVGGAPVSTVWNVPYLDLSVRGPQNPTTLSIVPLDIAFPSGQVKAVFELQDLLGHTVQTSEAIIHPGVMDEGGLGSGSTWDVSYAFMSVRDGSYIVKVWFYEDGNLVAQSEGPIQVV